MMLVLEPEHVIPCANNPVSEKFCVEHSISYGESSDHLSEFDRINAYSHEILHIITYIHKVSLPYDK